jgi:YVTN family beta-propeller protein
VVVNAAGQQPAQLATAGGRVYVASYLDHTVVVLDPETLHRVGRPVPVAFNPYAVAAGGGHVWVTNLGAGSLTRLDYQRSS